MTVTVTLDIAPALASWARAGARLGTRVTEQGMLHPVKSHSQGVGVGSGLKAKPLRRHCECCSSRPTCGYRGH